MVAVNLDDVVGSGGRTQEAATFRGVDVDSWILEDAAGVRRIRTGHQLHDRSHQFNRVHMGGAVHERRLGFLAAGAAEDEHALLRMPSDAVRGEATAAARHRWLGASSAAATSPNDAVTNRMPPGPIGASSGMINTQPTAAPVRSQKYSA